MRKSAPLFCALLLSLSARRAWIEKQLIPLEGPTTTVALRKESVDRKVGYKMRNAAPAGVALRKESVDRKLVGVNSMLTLIQSLSARRAWIEKSGSTKPKARREVALRKESVDRKIPRNGRRHPGAGVALRKESVDRKTSIDNITQGVFSRSPQGERG